MRIRYLKNEARRLARQYATAIWVEAKSRPGGLLRSAYRILEARARHGVGPVQYSLYRFSSKPRAEWGDYVTDGPDFKGFLRERNPESGRRITKDKLAFHHHCLAHGLPTVPIICTIGRPPDASGARVPIPEADSLENWRAILEAAPRQLFIKPIDGTHGEGAFTVDQSEGRAEYEGQQGTVDDLYRHVRGQRGFEGGWLVQPRLFPDERLKGLVSSHSLSTVRIVTQSRAGHAEPLGAVLKVTVGRNAIDNFVFGSTGNLVAGIDLQTGRLTGVWGSARSDWPAMEPIARHPESGQPFDGVVLPFWADMVALALRGQRSFPSMRTLGWDIAPAREGLTIVEANSTYDVSLLQAAYQRGFKRYLLDALS